MSDRFVAKGFAGRKRQSEPEGRVPPGQYVTEDFPVLTAGPNPHTPLSVWSFEITGLLKKPIQWNWAEFNMLPSRYFTCDVHCVTKWSKLDTQWRGVSVETLLEYAEIDPRAQHVMAFCDGDYTANLPLADVLDGKAFIAFEYEGEPLAPEHGGPARLVVPHLYFWKSAKWVRGLHLMEQNAPGFWEDLGYHTRGDPWQEQRYRGD